MRKLLLGIGLLTLSSISCEKLNEVKQGAKEELTPKLYITKNIVKEKPGRGGESKQFKETYVFTDTYIELCVFESTLGGYQVQCKLPSEERPDGIVTSNYLIVTDDGGNPINYETPSELLYYMDGVGYEMVAKKNSEYGKVYTFKKK